MKKQFCISLLFLTLCAILLLFASIIIYLFKEKRTTEGKTEVVATFIDTRLVNTVHGIYKYFIKDKSMEYYGSSFATQVYGEKFLLYYDNDDTTEIDIHYDKPVFTKRETKDTKFSTAKIISKNFGIIGRMTSQYTGFINFAYTLNGVDYERIQYVPIDFEERYPNVNINKEYQIRYWLENPQRAIIYFDMPVQEGGFRIIE
jgi:hypothetical protein